MSNTTVLLKKKEVIAFGESHHNEYALICYVRGRDIRPRRRIQ